MQRPFPDDPQHWLLRAEEARVLSELINDPKSKRAMLEIAERCEQVAKHVESRAEDLEKRPPTSSIRPEAFARKKRWF